MNHEGTKSTKHLLGQVINHEGTKDTKYLSGTGL